MIDLLMLGTGAMVPLPERFLSSVLFRVNGSLNLIDCGEGTQVSWRRFHWGFRRLDAIVLTHHHADHVAGLPGLFHTVANSGRTEPMQIYGPPGTVDVIKGLRVIAPHLPYDMEIRELEGGDTFVLPSGVRGRAAWGEHRGDVLGYRFEVSRKPGFLPARARELGVPQGLWGRLQRGEAVRLNGREVRPDEVLGPPREGLSFAMVTDTRPTEELRELATGVDLLICEGTYGDDADAPKAVEKHHMTFREAATLAREAGARALWLTHFGVSMTNPEQWIDNALAVFPTVEVGRSGLTGRLLFDEGYRPGTPAPSISPASTDST